MVYGLKGNMERIPSALTNSACWEPLDNGPYAGQVCEEHVLIHIRTYNVELRPATARP